MGHSPINIYIDRPNIYLNQLSNINFKFFIIGNYNGEVPSSCRKISYITPDIKPHIVLSQTKLENFETLKSIANDNGAKFIHYEMNFPSSKISPKAFKMLKNMRAYVNIFTDPYIMKSWEMDENEALVIENTAELIVGGFNNPTPYHISATLPLFHMQNGICPIVFKTPYSSQFINNGLNGFLYSDESELSFIINKIQKMDKEDIETIGQNARKLVLDKFKKEKFLESWKKIIRSII